MFTHASMAFLVGPVMSKFTTAFRELGSYKELLRSQVIVFVQFFLFLIHLYGSSFKLLLTIALKAILFNFKVVIHW